MATEIVLDYDPVSGLYLDPSGDTNLQLRENDALHLGTPAQIVVSAR